METKKKQLSLLDYCTPDYFTGYHRPVISIPVFGVMTNKDIAEGIQEELNACWDMFADDYSKTEMLIVDHFCDQLLLDPEKVFVEEEELEEYDECNYLYFGICKPVRKYGITFLNS